MSSLRTTYQSLDNETFSIDPIYEGSKAMEKISHLDKSYQDASERLKEAYYNLDDIKSFIYQTIESLDFDEDAFNQMQERSFELVKIEHKYQKIN